VLEETHDSDQIIQRVAALDVGKAELTCCVRVPGQGSSGKRLQEVRTYQTMTRSLLVLADRLGELGVTRVVMEATSVPISLAIALAMSLASRATKAPVNAPISIRLSSRSPRIPPVQRTGAPSAALYLPAVPGPAHGHLGLGDLPLGRSRTERQGPDSVRHRRENGHRGPTSVRQTAERRLTQPGPPQVNKVRVDPHLVRQDSGGGTETVDCPSQVDEALPPARHVFEEVGK
jgi:hypothetical protein